MSSVTEVKQSTGRWQLDLIEGTPRQIIDQLTPFGHIAIAPGKIDVAQVGDNLLTEARYVGVYRGGKVAGEGFSLEGSGMAFWVGDEDGKGPLIETLAVSAASFAAAINAVLPDAVEAGTLFSVGGSATLTHTFQWETAKSALNFVTRAFATPTAPVSWRINGDATIDAGPDTQLFRTTPTAILVKKDAVLRTGRGFDIIGVSGDLQLEEAYNDYTTKVVVIGQGEGGAYIAASASLAASAIAYQDMHGNPVSFTRLVDSIDEDGISVADALAASLLSRFDSASYGATLSSDDFDVRGDFVPGDHVATFAPDIGFVDYANEMYYEGVPINPLFIQVQGMTWPIPSGFTVGFRTMGGTWLDLSDYYRPTGGQTLIDVGDNPSGLTNAGMTVNRERFTADSSVPATPVFGEFFTSHYLNVAGESRGQVLVTWSQPLNTDGSTIVDGHHYEIRYRPNVTAPYAATWGEAAQDTWAELFTWMQPRVPPFDNDEWHPVEAPFDVEQIMVTELFPSVIYEFQIRAVDGANPPNKSAWSASTAFTVARDTLPPSQPAAPVVAGSRLSLQIIHHLGISAGGTFNLDRDTQYLEVHVSGDPLFFPDDSTLVGRLQVNAALASGTPVVGTFNVEETTERYVRVVAVDREGNRSNASNTATATIELVDDAHISDLTVSKVTAGTISADWLLSAAIKTAVSGQRMELNADGLQAYDSDGAQTINLSADPDDTGQYLSLKNAGATLASISDEGVGSFQALYVNDAYVGGDSLIDTFVRLPSRGIVAFGVDSSDVAGTGPASFKGYLELAFDAEDGRAYKITTYGECETTSTALDERYIHAVLDGGTSKPTVASTNIGGATVPAVNDSTARNTTCINLIYLRCPEDITAGTHRLLWVFYAEEGTATLQGSQGPSYFIVEDVGPSDWYENTAVLNDGTGGVTPVVKTYVTTYTSTWSASYGDYDSGGSKELLDVEYVRQGDSPTYGNTIGLFGFSSQIATDLAGATVKRINFSAYANYWHEPSGGTAVIGYHDYTSAPATLSGARVNENEQLRENWPNPGLVTTSLNSALRTAFENGDATGIAMGEGLSGSEIYSARFDGATQPYPATLQITYVK